MVPHVQGTTSSSTPTCTPVKGKTRDRSRSNLARPLGVAVYEASPWPVLLQSYKAATLSPMAYTLTYIQWTPQLQWGQRSLPGWKRHQSAKTRNIFTPGLNAVEQALAEKVLAERVPAPGNIGRATNRVRRNNHPDEPHGLDFELSMDYIPEVFLVKDIRSYSARRDICSPSPASSAVTL